MTCEGKWEGPGEIGELSVFEAILIWGMGVAEVPQTARKSKKCSARPSKRLQARVSCQTSSVSPRNGAQLMQVHHLVFPLKKHRDVLAWGHL